MQAETEAYKKFQVGEYKVDLSHPGAYFAFVNKDTGEPAALFGETDVALHKVNRTQRDGYLDNPVYPFNPEKAKSVLEWATAQGEKHGFAAGSITFDKSTGQWVFPQVNPPTDTANVKTTNNCGSAILCCAEIKAIDPSKDFVFYYASLNNFAKKLVGNMPVQMIYPHRLSHGDDPYTKYKYLFNTITYYEPRGGSDIEPILRRFGCNSLQGDDVVEFAFGDNWDIKIDKEGKLTKKNKVNDRGKQAENDKDGEGSSKAKKKRKNNKKRKASKKGKEVDHGEDDEHDDNGEDGEHVEQGGEGDPIEIAEDAEPIGAPEDREPIEIADEIERIEIVDDADHIEVVEAGERIEDDENDKDDENDGPSQANKKGKAKKRRRPNKKGKGKEIESVEAGEQIPSDKNREASSNVKDGENEHPRMVFSTVSEPFSRTNLEIRS